MKFRSIALLAAWTLFCSSSDAASSLYIDRAKAESAPSMEEIQKKIPKIIVRSGCHAPDLKSAKELILRSFDPHCLSNYKCSVKYEIFFWYGIPIYRKIFSKNDTASDDFYCEQAIWETQLPNFYSTAEPVICEFDATANALYGHHAELIPDEKTVCLHAIPSGYGLADRAFPDGSLTTSKNVLRIKRSDLNDPRLKSFRLDSNFVWFPPYPAEKVSERAAAAKAQYQNLFCSDEVKERGSLSPLHSG